MVRIRRDGKFSKALRKALAARDMSQATLAEKLRVDRMTVGRWLSGSEPTSTNFKKLVKIFPELKKFEGKP